MEFLLSGILAVTWRQAVMYVIGGVLIWLAVKKGFEPALLLPMGFGSILVNLPFSGAGRVDAQQRARGGTLQPADQ